MLYGDLARLITLDPAHFHAALIQKQMLTGFPRAWPSLRRSGRTYCRI